MMAGPADCGDKPAPEPGRTVRLLPQKPALPEKTVRARTFADCQFMEIAPKDAAQKAAQRVVRMAFQLSLADAV